jgi:hypothetical protein
MYLTRGDMVCLLYNRFLYNLFLSMDANFKLKRRSYRIDPQEALGAGLAYFVDLAAFREHLVRMSKDPDPPEVCFFFL